MPHTITVTDEQAQALARGESVTLAPERPARHFRLVTRTHSTFAAFVGAVYLAEYEGERCLRWMLLVPCRGGLSEHKVARSVGVWYRTGQAPRWECGYWCEYKITRVSA